ncbi:ClpXP protease specificity-enhancing factor [Spartinivicinus ruber]|uniref:ClpXP protease specificity-enhancing factor n=1 Tax=Spartinivicinus ruber TaxID=2683272 RepID=UPI002E3230A1|nr:ClpXP protease specificity-enhancing factor [Spartinivicinus ruber]
MSMSSSRPYIIRALYEWIVDNDCTPYILVNAEVETVEVPQEYVKDGQIVLNISPTAVRDLLISNDAIDFNGRFGGIARHLHVPTYAVMAIYARENGQGMVFDTEETPEPTPDPTPISPEPATKSGKPSGRPSLKVVK